MTEDNAGTDDGQGDTGADNGDGGGEGTSFLDSITNEDLKGNELLSGHETIDSLAEDYVKIKAGAPIVPEKAEDYTMSDEHKEVFADDEAVNGFRAVALEANLTQEQYDALLGFESKRAAEWLKTAQDNQAESKKALQDEFGDKLDEKIAGGIKVLEATDSKELMARADLDADPNFLKFLVKISDMISEDKLETGGTGTGDDSRPVGEDGSPRLKYPSMGDK